MAATATLPSLLNTLTDSLTSAASSLPSATNLAPPADGISLLDNKNELLLSYLHNLVFLLILKLRNQSSTSPAEESSLNDVVIQKLVELRIYTEKGVRPLEGRLKYQLDKLLLAASDASVEPVPTGAIKIPNTSERRTVESNASASDSDAEQAPRPAIPDLAYRPNPSAFARPSDSKATRQSTSDGLYRPPRITPTALPNTDALSRKKEVKPRKSHTLNAFIREEMDDAPIAEPSIGAGSGLRGREKEKEEEKRGYEETRLVRLPGEKKKKDRRRGDGFGEDLADGLGDFDFEGLKGKGGKRKRERDGGDEGRVGELWEKRVKKGVGRKRR
ncbi:MAG: hypothetical protein ASARMPREDX12_003764 [Alectoria sarmentosa]|nr:MAG: hypothetical protein ASARMPREDX12_003764 [Alectoria sarmentosa]